MSETSRKSPPQARDGVDIRSLPIRPEEAFVFTRVDGLSTVAELAAGTGLTEEAIVAALAHLEELGAIHYETSAESGTEHRKPGHSGEHRTTPTSSDGSTAGSTPPATSPSATAAPDVGGDGDGDRKSEVGVINPKRVLRNAPIVEQQMRSLTDSHPAAALYDPAELDEDVPLELDRKREILDLYYRLESLDHYELLGVPYSADKKDVRQAYFEIVPKYHPDKFFGKNLGTFKAKLEKIFERLTKANDTLTRKKTRAEYDAYLESKRKATQLDAMLRPPSDKEVMRARTQVQAEVRISEKAGARVDARREPGAGRPTQPSAQPGERPGTKIPKAPGLGGLTGGGARGRGNDAPRSPSPPPTARRSAPPPPPGPRRPSSPGVPTPPAARRPSVPPPVSLSDDPEARRRALARRLSGRPQPKSHPGAPSSDTPGASMTREQIADELKRRYETRLKDAQVDQADRLLQDADEALSDNNPVAAANSLRLALSLSPDDERLRHRLEEVQQKAHAKLADNYIEQANYEERQRNWDEAARSYERASLGRPTNASLAERAAYCLLEAGGDMRKASEFGRKAVMIDPDKAEYRVTLARVYVKANMSQSAEAEFERAAKLAPKDDKIRDWVKRFKRGEL